MLLNKITEKQNLFIAELKQLAREGFPIYIYGASLGSDQIMAILEKEKIPFVGKMVDKLFYFEKEGVYCLEDTIEILNTKINLIIAHRGFKEEKLEKYKGKINKVINRDSFAGILNLNTPFSYQWTIDNIDSLQWMYNLLKDDLSRETFVAYIIRKLVQIINIYVK